MNDSSEKKLPTLEEVDAFPLPELLIPRVMKDSGYTREQAEIAVREAKRMLYIRAAGAKTINPSIFVDEGWHAMLLFTRFYEKFANFIGRYVHHEPTPPKKLAPGEKRPVNNNYEHTKQAYEEILGFKPDPRYWP